MSQLDLLLQDLQTISLVELGPVDLQDGHGIINNAVMFVEAHTATLRRNSGNKTYLPYFHRLQKFHSLVMNK